MKLIIYKKRDRYIVGGFLFILILVVFVVTGPVIIFQKVEIKFIKSESTKLQKHVEYLSELKPGRAYFNKDSLNNSAKYIKDVFSQYCESTEEQIFVVDNAEYKNISCSFNKDKKERVIIGAHYDSYIGLPGADDNASGVAGLLELARMLSVNKPAVEKRIDIVAYSLEEPPFFRSENMGSYHHASMLQKEKADIKLVIILEMIGYYSNESKSQNIPLFLSPLYPTKGDFVAVVGKIGQGNELRYIKKKLKEIMDTGVYSINGFSFVAGIDLSDHLSYWKNNYPAVMITDTSFYRNKNYHTENDTANTLDYNRMADLVNGIYWAIINI